MANLQLQIIQNGQKQTLTLNNQKQTVLTAQANTQYQLLNEQGVLIIEPTTQMVGQDLWVLEHEQPFLIIKNYQNMNPIQDLDTLMSLQSTFATGHSHGSVAMWTEPEMLTHTTAMTAQTISTPVLASTSMSSATKVGLGALGVLAIGGIAAAAGGGGGGSSGDNQKAPPAPRIQFNPITADNILNIQESNATVWVSGSVHHAHAGDVITLSVGNQQFHATVQNDLQFGTQISGSVLKQNTQISGSLKTITDGQTLSATQTHTYRVDTEIAKPVIQFNALTGDNFLTENELTGKITVSGSVQNAKQGDTIQLTIANQTHSSTLNAQGQFSVEIDGQTLRQHTQIQAHITTSDDAQNTASGQNSLTYQIDPAAFRPVIQLNKITGDNVLNTTETKGHILVSGSITHVAQGETIKLQLGTQTINATVSNNGTFSASISGELLAKQTQISAQYTHNGTVLTATQHYEILPDPMVKLTAVDGDNVIDVAQLTAISRISGSLNVNGMLAKWRAPGILREITLHIGDKAYTTALTHHHTFQVDIPTAEWATLSGKEITYSLNHLTNLNALVVETDNYYVPMNVQGTPSTALNLLTLTHPDITGRVGNYRVGEINQTVHITGSVDENGREGNVILVEVNQQTYRTTVDAHHRFAVDVKLHDILADSDHTITARLEGATNSDTLNYTVTEKVSTGDFVSGNQNLSINELPYFINVVNAIHEYKDYSVGYLTHKTAGTGQTIRYHFVTQAELNDLTDTRLALDDVARLERHGLNYLDGTTTISNLMLTQPVTYSDKQQNQVRQAIANISKYANVQFVEVDNTADSDMDYYLVETDWVAPNSAGYAYFGADVYLNKTRFANGFEHQDGMSTVVHETLHSLGLKHPHREADDDARVPVLNDEQDSSGVSIMSYALDDYLASSEPHLYDLAFLHYYYGVNPEARAEDNVYTFKNFNRTVADGDIYIWDGGGTDTFSAANETQGVLVNLTAGSWIFADKNHTDTTALGLIQKHPIDAESYLSGSLNPIIQDLYTYAYDFTEGVAFIGYGTQLENLIGSQYDDILTGNATGNIIHGGAGNDVIDGGAGSDQLTGGAGQDTFVFSDVLDGKSIDVITDFDIHEDKIGLARSVFTQVNDTMADFSRYIQYNADTGALSYDANGTGQGVQFATLSSHLELAQNHFVLI